MAGFFDFVADMFGKGGQPSVPMDQFGQADPFGGVGTGGGSPDLTDPFIRSRMGMPEQMVEQSNASWDVLPQPSPVISEAGAMGAPGPMGTPEELGGFPAELSQPGPQVATGAGAAPVTPDVTAAPATTAPKAMPTPPGPDASEEEKNKWLMALVYGAQSFASGMTGGSPIAGIESMRKDVAMKEEKKEREARRRLEAIQFEKAGIDLQNTKLDFANKQKANDPDSQESKTAVEYAKIKIAQLPLDQQKAALMMLQMRPTASAIKEFLPNLEKDVDNYRAVTISDRQHKEKLASEERRAEAERRRLEQGDRRLDIQDAAQRAQAARLESLIAASNRANQPIQPAAAGEQVSGLTRDKQGNVKLAADVDKALKESSAVAEQVGKGMSVAQDLKKLIETGKPAESIPGAAIAKAGQVLPGSMQPGLTTSTAELQQKVGRLVAFLNDPRMKGNPSNMESLRVEKIISDPTISNENKLKAINELMVTMQTDIDRHNEAYNRFDEATRQRLDAAGYGVVKPGGKGSQRTVVERRVVPGGKTVVKYSDGSYGEE